MRLSGDKATKPIPTKPLRNPSNAIRKRRKTTASSLVSSLSQTAEAPAGDEFKNLEMEIQPVDDLTVFSPFYSAPIFIPGNEGVLAHRPDLQSPYSLLSDPSALASVEVPSELPVSEAPYGLIGNCLPGYGYTVLPGKVVCPSCSRRESLTGGTARAGGLSEPGQKTSGLSESKTKQEKSNEVRDSEEGGRRASENTSSEQKNISQVSETRHEEQVMEHPNTQRGRRGSVTSSKNSPSNFKGPESKKSSLIAPSLSRRASVPQVHRASVGPASSSRRGSEILNAARKGILPTVSFERRTSDRRASVPHETVRNNYRETATLRSTASAPSVKRRVSDKLEDSTPTCKDAYAGTLRGFSKPLFRYSSPPSRVLKATVSQGETDVKHPYAPSVTTAGTVRRLIVDDLLLRAGLGNPAGGSSVSGTAAEVKGAESRHSSGVADPLAVASQKGRVGASERDSAVERAQYGGGNENKSAAVKLDRGGRSGDGNTAEAPSEGYKGLEKEQSKTQMLSKGERGGTPFMTEDNRQSPYSGNQNFILNEEDPTSLRSKTRGENGEKQGGVTEIKDDSGPCVTVTASPRRNIPVQSAEQRKQSKRNDDRVLNQRPGRTANFENFGGKSDCRNKQVNSAGVDGLDVNYPLGFYGGETSAFPATRGLPENRKVLFSAATMQAQLPTITVRYSPNDIRAAECFENGVNPFARTFSVDRMSSPCCDIASVPRKAGIGRNISDVLFTGSLVVDESRLPRRLPSRRRGPSEEELHAGDYLRPQGLRCVQGDENTEPKIRYLAPCGVGGSRLPPEGVRWVLDPLENDDMRVLLNIKEKKCREGKKRVVTTDTVIRPYRLLDRTPYQENTIRYRCAECAAAD